MDCLETKQHHFLSKTGSIVAGREAMSRLHAMLDEGIADENVVFYPSLGINPDDGSDCKIEVRGRISQELRLQGLASIALILAGPHAKDLTEFPEEALRLFKDRVKQFILLGERNEQFDVAISSEFVKSAPSDPQGFFGFSTPWLKVSAANIRAQTQGNGSQ